MQQVTDPQIDRALSENADPHQRGGEEGWRFRGSFLPPVWHTDEEARMITRFCLMLDRPVSDVLTSDLFAALVDEVAVLRDAVYRLGGTFR